MALQSLLSILGEATCPVLPWLMKPFLRQLGRRKELFNYTLNHCRQTMECAFGRLTGQWRVLLWSLDADIEHIPCVRTAC